MKKSIVFLILTIFYISTVLGQTKQSNSFKDATFCGKVGESGAKGGFYTVAELQNCDFKIIPVDSNFTVTEFQLSLVAKGELYQYQERKIKGNEIPKEERTRILTQTKNVFIEQIKAVNKEGQIINIKPIAVRIQ
ncbi:MAG: hypothetical protein ABIT08_04850 [Bacteroidia bacterium]